MGLFDQFPYTNFHELNLMWILEALKEIQTTTEQFVAINSLKYANPIQWNITSQYEKNTIVIDPQTGTAYISVQPVPTGVALANTDYWTVVFNLGSFVVRAARNFTPRYEEDTTLTATFNIAAGEWVVWGDTLYVANVNITAGDSYVVDGNISRITVEEAKDEIYTTFNNLIGNLNNLSTTDKSNLVNAINEVLTQLNAVDIRISNNIGPLTNLNTTDKTSIVNAINELVGIIGALANLNTTDKTSIVNAINELVTSLTTLDGKIDAVDTRISNNIGPLTNLNTTDKTSIVNAINEVNTTGGGALALIGDLTNLDTTYKTNLVGAINEVRNQKPKPYKISKILIVADSYGLVAGSIADQLTPYGYDVDQVALGGAGFGTGTKLKTALDNYTGNKSEVDHIIIVAGANDLDNDSSAVYSGMEAFMDDVALTYPNAIVHLGHFGVRMSTPMSVNSVWNYKIGAALYNMHYMVNSEYTLRNTNFLSSEDLLHPTSGGVAQIAQQILRYFEIGICDVEYVLACTLTGTSPISNGRVQMIRRNGSVVIRPVLASEYILNYTSGTSMPSTVFTAGTLNRTLINQEATDFFTLSGYATDATHTTGYPCFLNCRVTNNTLYITPVTQYTPTNFVLGSFNVELQD